MSHEVIPALDTHYTLDLAGASSAGAGGDDVGHGPVSAAVILRYKWLILAIFFPLCVLTVPAAWYFTHPIYQATASVHVAPVASRIIFETEENTRAGNMLYSSFVETQVAIIQSSTVLQRVLENKIVQRTGWYKQGTLSLMDRLKSLLGSPPPDPLERLKKSITVSRPKRGELITVSMDAEDPRAATLIANSVVDNYEAYYREEVRHEELSLLAELEEKKTELETLIAGLERRRVSLPSFLGPSEIEELATLEAKRGDLEVERDLTAWEVKHLTNPENGEEGATGPAPPPAVAQLYAADTRWQELHTAHLKALYELHQAEKTLGASHPKIRKLEADATYAEQRLHAREQEIDAGPEYEAGAPATSGSPAVLIAALRKQEEELNLLGARIAKQRDRAVNAADIIDLDGMIARSRRLLERVKDRKEARETESRAPARVSVLSRAVRPSRPYRDRRLLYTLMAFSMSLMAGLVAAYIKGSVNPKIFEAGEVQRLTQVPFLGQLPRLPHKPDCTKPLPWPLAEGLRMVRTALLQRLDGTKDRVVLITSADGNVGKTTVAIGLAQSLAQLGKKTLLVEADLRKPTFSRVMELGPSSGLAAILTGRERHGTAILKDVTPGLDVLPAGDGQEEFDPELLANGLFGACLQRWKRDYDFIVLDSPPVLPVADARILTAQADGTIMVLRASHCRRADAIRAYADLSAAGSRLVGSILVNDHRHFEHALGYGQYSYAQGQDPDRMKRLDG